MIIATCSKYPSRSRLKLMKKNQNGFVPVIIILVVLIGFVGAYFIGTFKNKSTIINPSSSPLAIATQSAVPTIPTVKQTTDPTANWKTYTDVNSRFSFRHPNLDTNCCMIGGPFHGNATHVATFANTTTTREGTDKPFDGFAVYIDSTDKTSLEEYFNQEKSGISGYYKEAYNQTPPPTSFSQVTIGDNQAIVFKYKSLSASYVLSLPNGGKLILIMTEEKEGSFQPTLNQILSTFKFTQ